VICSWYLPSVKILLIGANGQLARDLHAEFTAAGNRHEIIPVTHEQLDIRDKRSVDDLMAASRPECIINTAAFHRVDQCEDETETTFAVNENGVLNLAQAAHQQKALLVQLSTDYVFDGVKRSAYVERDEANPLSIYGKSRLAGELAVQQNCARYIIIRTCGLYGMAGSQSKTGNFAETMLKLAAAKKTPRVVNDQVCTPTSTRELARHMIRLIPSGAQGLFHMTSTGECSWFDFARQCFRLAGVHAAINPVSSEQYGAKAKRPAYSVLDNLAYRSAGFSDFRPWQEALAEYMQTRKKVGLQSS
jgi:dTDP-4-dehydrorhamnose reductase